MIVTLVNDRGGCVFLLKAPAYTAANSPAFSDAVEKPVVQRIVFISGL
jgi:hypothetical protein